MVVSLGARGEHAMATQPGFFDVKDRLKRPSDLGVQLEAFSAAVDFALFRPTLDAVLAYSDGVRGGRPPLDPVMMFKVLVIQAANSLSDERAEYWASPFGDAAGELGEVSGVGWA